MHDPAASPVHLCLLGADLGNPGAPRPFAPSFLMRRPISVACELDRERVIALSAVRSLKKLECYIDLWGPCVALPLLSSITDLTLHALHDRLPNWPRVLHVPALPPALRSLQLPDFASRFSSFVTPSDLHTLQAHRLYIRRQPFENPFASFPALRRLKATLLSVTHLDCLPSSLTHLALTLDRLSVAWRADVWTPTNRVPIHLAELVPTTRVNVFLLLETLPTMPALVAFALTNNSEEVISIAPMARSKNIRTLHVTVGHAPTMATRVISNYDLTSDLRAFTSLTELKLAGFLVLPSLRFDLPSLTTLDLSELRVFSRDPAFVTPGFWPAQVPPESGSIRHSPLPPLLP